jgi:hypothetical protein
MGDAWNRMKPDEFIAMQQSAGWRGNTWDLWIARPWQLGQAR